MPREEGASIEFYEDQQQDDAATKAAGRPIFKTVEMVWVRIVGDPTRDWKCNAHERCIIARHVGGGFLSPAERYPDHYAVFKKQQVDFASGTPLEMLPFVSKSRVYELKAKNIFTAEQLAGLSDRLISENGPGTRNEVNMTKAWLDQADQANQVAQANAERDALEARLKAMEERLAAAERPKGAEPVDGVDSWDDERLRAYLSEQGIKPRANASRENLVGAVRGLMADAA